MTKNLFLKRTQNACVRISVNFNSNYPLYLTANLQLTRESFS